MIKDSFFPIQGPESIGIQPKRLVKPPYDDAINAILQTVIVAHGGGIGIVANVANVATIERVKDWVANLPKPASP